MEKNSFNEIIKKKLSVKENERMKEEQKKKNYKYFNSKEIARLFNVMAETTDIQDFNYKDIVLNDKIYNLTKEKNILTINCSDNRTLKLEMKLYDDEESQKYLLNYEGAQSYANIYFIYPDKSTLILSSYLGNKDSYRFFKNINGDGLESNLKLFYKNNDLKHGIELSYNYNYIKYNLPPETFEFFDQGILYNYNTILSSDGKNIIATKDGNVLPQDMLTFNKKEEIYKVKTLLKSDITLHPYTKELLTEALDKLYQKEYEANYLSNIYKNIIPLSQNIIKARNDMINNIKNNGFTKEELLFINLLLISKIKKEYDNQNSKIFIKK